MIRPALCSLLLALMTACGGPATSGDAGGDAADAGAIDAGGPADAGQADTGRDAGTTDTGSSDSGAVDAGPIDTGDADTGVDGGTDAGSDTGALMDVCKELGIPPVAFSPGPYGKARNAIAGEFTVPTTRGPWTFSERFSGCETYVFIPDATPLTAGEPAPLWSNDIDMLVWSSPKNVHYFFVSTEGADTAATAAVEAMEQRVRAFLALLAADQQRWWRPRIHFVTGSIPSIGGWVGGLLASPGLGFGIDRFQRIRDLGSLADPNRYNADRGWFDSNLRYVAYEPEYYDFEWARQQALDAEQPVLVTVFNAETLQGAVDRDVTFPDAATMAGFDTMVIDLTAACPAGPEPNSCGQWDYLQWLHLCDAGNPSTCGTELGRWITSYAREGRWTTDASQMLALLKDGGARRLRFDASGQTYVVTLTIRLLNRGKGARPVEAIPLWSGGAFDKDYNTRYQPVTVALSADARKVELYAVITGHGFGVEKENCAEFCPHSHHFTLNGQEYVKENPDAGSSVGCADQVRLGTVPNQDGTWFFGRGGWCPGREVSPWTADVTAAAVPGGDNVVEYRALLYGAPYVPEPSGGSDGFPGRVDMTSFLIVWK